VAERDRIQPGQPVAAAGVGEGSGEVVLAPYLAADQLCRPPTNYNPT
jgi:hypothetical protein